MKRGDTAVTCLLGGAGAPLPSLRSYLNPHSLTAFSPPLSPLISPCQARLSIRLASAILRRRSEAVPSCSVCCAPSSGRPTLPSPLSSRGSSGMDQGSFPPLPMTPLRATAAMSRTVGRDDMANGWQRVRGVGAVTWW